MKARYWLLVATGVVALACRAPAPSTSPPPVAPAEKNPTGLPEIDRVTPLPSPLPEVAARVNGRPVSSRNVLLAAQNANKGPVADDERPYMYRRFMQEQIIRELLFQEALSRGIQADDRLVEQAYDEARFGHKDDAEWKALLGKGGLDPQTYRQELRLQKTVDTLLAQEARKVAEPTDEEAEAFYRANPGHFDTGELLRVSHILLRMPEGMSVDRKGVLRTRLEGILARIKTGEDFGKLARENSEDQASAVKDGKLDAFARADMAKAFSDAAFALKPGQVSDVVETPSGFHIIKLHERLSAETLDFGEVKERVKEGLRQQRRQDGIRELVSRLRARARIETYL